MKHQQRSTHVSHQGLFQWNNSGGKTLIGLGVQLAKILFNSRRIFLRLADARSRFQPCKSYECVDAAIIDNQRVALFHGRVNVDRSS